MNGGVARTEWTQAAVFSESVVRMAAEVPTPVLASTHLTRPVRDYLAWWISHPDPNGTFAARTRWVKRAPDAWLARALFVFGYDGLIYLTGDAVVGHVFFQRRGADVHGFSTAVSNGFDGHGYSVVMMMDYVTYALRLPGVARVRVGTGGNNVTRRFLERVKKNEVTLGWRVGDDGWVARFAPPDARR
jgi:hypothetical protein